MKRAVMMLGLSVLLSTVWLSAQTSGNGALQPTGQGRGVFVDTNKNGVCDNYEARQANLSNNRGQGYRHNAYGQGRGGSQRGRNFVDANKNGVCDYYENRNTAGQQK